MSTVPLSEEDLHELYTWVDEIPISRPKRNIARDFSDGCCVAEILKFFFPKLVELHNYVPSMSHSKKVDNWATLNARVFRKLYFEVPSEEIEDIVAAVPGAIERFLRALRTKIVQIKAKHEELLEMGAVPSGSYVINRPRGTFSSRPSAAANAPPPSTKYMTSSQKDRPVTAPPERKMNLRKGNEARSTHEPSLAPKKATKDELENERLRLLVEEKDRTVLELRETVSILTEKISKLEELVHVKDSKLLQYRTKFGRV